MTAPTPQDVADAVTYGEFVAGLGEGLTPKDRMIADLAHEVRRLASDLATARQTVEDVCCGGCQ